MSEEVEISWEGQKHKVEIGKINFGNMIGIIGKVVSLKADDKGRMKVEITNLPEYIEGLLLGSIKKAPFKIEITNIRKLSSEDGMKLFLKAQDLNPLALA